MAGTSYFLLNRGPAYDRDSLLRAIDIYQLYLQRYPRGFYAEQAEERLSEAVNRMAEKEMDIARFYLRQDQDFGARVHLANVVLLFPDTEPGREARKLLDERGWDTSLNSKDTIKPRRRFGGNR
jgi:outer membrane protein assembly factor BamD